MKQYTDKQLLLELNRSRCPQHLLTLCRKYPQQMYDQLIRLYTDETEKSETQIMNGLYVLSILCRDSMRQEWYQQYYSLIQKYKDHSDKRVRYDVREKHFKPLRQLQLRKHVRGLLSNEEVSVHYRFNEE